MRLAVARVAPGPLAAPPLELLAELAQAARAEAAELLLLPERFAIGGLDGEAAIAAADLSDGALPHAIGRIAATAGIHLMVGYAESCVTGIYNAAQLFDGRGLALANYRQSHRPTAAVDPLARGHWLSAMPALGEKLGLLIGYDLEFPEPARALSLAGAGLLLVAGGLSGPSPTMALALARARAFENGCWLALAAGAEASCIIAPDGSRAGQDAAGGRLLLADLPVPAATEPLRAARLADRRPRLYAELAHEPAGLPHRRG
jgi:predicted amidohydrolase